MYTIRDAPLHGSNDKAISTLINATNKVAANKVDEKARKPYFCFALRWHGHHKTKTLIFRDPSMTGGDNDG
jgi:hypothetical protein